MAQHPADEMRRVVNESGQVVTVHKSHPITRNPNARVLPDEADAGEPTEPLPFADWSADELLAYAERNGIDVGRATAADTLAKRIRDAERGSEG